jgi:hypothetical protein
VFLVIFIFMAGLGVGGYLFYFKKLIVADLPDPVAARIADIDKVRDLLLLGVKHDYVQNTKLGPLVVITGRVKNNFNVPKDKIRVEASLLDKEGKVLAVQQQYCGIILSDIQLRVLGQKELTHALDNNFEMLANNINIKPGAEVPFMVVFAYPPSSMAEYSVMVADVSDSPDMSAPPAK